jgi:hypothetical protein
VLTVPSLKGDFVACRLRDFTRARSKTALLEEVELFCDGVAAEAGSGADGATPAKKAHDNVLQLCDK